MIENRL